MQGTLLDTDDLLVKQNMLSLFLCIIKWGSYEAWIWEEEYMKSKPTPQQQSSSAWLIGVEGGRVKRVF